LLLLAYSDPAGFDQLPDLPTNYGLPTWKLVMQTPRQTVQSIRRLLKIFTTHADGGGEGNEQRPKLDPIVCGSPMGVETRMVSHEAMKALNDLRITLSSTMKISLNTLLQALVGYRLTELGLIHTPIYSIPVDLRRYLKNPHTFYPGNLSGQIRVKTASHPADELMAVCQDIQQQVEAQLAGGQPLAAALGETLTALDAKTYQRMNRDALKAAVNTDPRYFVLSNLGTLDADFGHVAVVDKQCGIFSAIPLMGGPPLVMNFSTIGGQGNLTITYNPRVLSQEQILAINCIVEPAWFTEIR
jgi:NRPS condensation-like uncharacterized protein